MITLADLIAQGDTSAAADQPLAPNWIQIRAGLYMFGRAAGGPEKVEIATFGVRFPERFEELSPDLCDLFPGAGPYGLSRTAILRLLAMLGHNDDPWEQLRMLIRRAGLPRRIEMQLAGLKTPALEAGLAPSEIQADWVWSLDAEKGVLTEEQLQRRRKREQKRGAPQADLAFSVRQRLRRAVVLFDELHDIPEIAVSGLLPPEPIGPPPIYDRQGRPKISLPPTLAHHHAGQPHPRGLPQVWQAICAAGTCDLPADPSADDLLAPDIWTMIQALPQEVTGYAGRTWHQYMIITRAVLLPHTSLPVPEHLPARYEAMIATNTDRWPIQALWRRLCERGGTMMAASPDDLLDLTTWRDLWRSIPDRVQPKTWRQYEIRARRILVRHAVDQVDPYRRVTHAWADLPTYAKALLDPIRKTAERSLLRPLDISPEWVEQQGLDTGQREEIHATLREVFFAAAQVRHPEPLPDPAAVAWETLRTAMRAQGIKTINLCRVGTPATNDGLRPSDLTLDWAVATAAPMEQRERSSFAMQLRKLDSMLGNLELAHLLYATPISALPDGRKRGKIEPPKAMLREMDAVTAAHRRAASTRREARALVRKLWTAAAVATGAAKIETLDELLSAAPALDIDSRTRSDAARYLRDLRSS